MSDEQRKNLLRLTGDGSWISSRSGWKSDSATAFGTEVVSRAADGKNDDTGYPGIGLVPRKGGSVTLSFWCKASQECEVVSHLFGDMKNERNAKKHADDGTSHADGLVVARVGTEWTYVRHTWTYDEDPWRGPMMIVARLTRVPVGVTVSVAGVMLVEGDTPAAWAPAEGETLTGGALS
ncbi:MAG: hypothetical protein SO057_07445 [Atopobiaceae bacterium]|nr:hypothetical protein [Atopobiaceae bacterium]